MPSVLESIGYKGFFLLALAVTSVGILFTLKKANYTIKKVLALVIAGVVSFLFGARILYLITSRYQLNTSNLFDTDLHGFSLFGGLIISCLVSLIICRKLKLPILKLADMAIVWIGLGIGIMRVGCFVNGCCFGKPTNMSWGIKFSLFSPAHIHQLNAGSGNLLHVDPVHPTQLYELAAAISGSFIAYKINKAGAKSNKLVFGTKTHGVAASVFILWFTFWRLIIHFFREIPDTYTSSQYLYPILYVSIILIMNTFLYSRFVKRS